ncbi:MAG TPA: UDP-N-acetylglucosamine diphosphorylase/glucosamine-1-phosphate N-acetyltransferase [Gammaproteobacteria bacterium]|jgi:bifunctional UDP-N-acetylglucosamine pyrophosphorylase/glucosamine-1-phosphate N-acetyltransferase|nr:UDP-N-acetylglucosamine diphosphorylase/glucosamine-1-phosphate N-acetyltransferase [Gammaproteobacteria bacterium]HIM22087.1 UDP-N-acetylglucosamine diphosphorylase/glucosamine-1-phosphate N-acetyltransferase [Gammaproteobacteria bacterium]
MNPDFIVLAAGNGKRMLGSSPKVLLPIGGKPMAQHILDTISGIEKSRPILVVGDQAKEVKNSLQFKRNTKIVTQRKQLGTAHAVKTALAQLRPSSVTVVLYGDVPLIEGKTLKRLIRDASKGALAILTFNKDRPQGYGRVVRGAKNQVEAIVEEKDATKEEKSINEVNSGILAIKSILIKKLLPEIKNNNAANEYYLTDIVSLSKKHGIKVQPLLLEDPDEALGANTPLELQDLERACQRIRAKKLVNSGVNIADIDRIDSRGSLAVGRGSFIDVNNVFEGRVEIGKNTKIGPNCYIKDSVIGNEVTLQASTVIEDSRVGDLCKLGPFARIRGGTEIEDNAELGNFVEANRSKIGPESKAKHLTYLGDSNLGRNVNIGAGTITCNYDGKNKYKTKLDDGAFIGSNTSLVAPVKVGKEASTGAGSVITKNVPPGSLAIGRSRQSNIKRKK